MHYRLLPGWRRYVFADSRALALVGVFLVVVTLAGRENVLFAGVVAAGFLFNAQWWTVQVACELYLDDGVLSARNARSTRIISLRDITAVRRSRLYTCTVVFEVDGDRPVRTAAGAGIDIFLDEFKQREPTAPVLLTDLRILDRLATSVSRSQYDPCP